MYQKISRFFKTLWSAEILPEDTSSTLAQEGAVKINVFALIFVSLTVGIIPLGASLFSNTALPFRAVFFVSILLAAVCAYLILRKKNCNYYVDKKKLTISILFIIVATVLFAMRINGGYMDEFCPTYIRALVTQVSQGRFPVSFISFPEFIANYHQGFVYLSGMLSYWTHMSPSYAVVATSIACFFLAVTMVQLFFLKINARYWYMALPIFVFLTSASVPWLPHLGWYNYVGVFEYFASNSFPVAWVLVLAMMWAVYGGLLDTRKIITIAFLIVTLSVINASVYSVVLLAFGWSLFSHLRTNRGVWNRKQLYTHAGLYLCALGILYVLPQYLPSAFLKGEFYDSPHLSFRFAGTPGEWWGQIKVIAFYLRLTGTLPIFGIVVALLYIRKSRIFLFRFLSYILVISFFFPILFKFSNINIWDNIHKFTIISMFVSIILVSLFLSQVTNRIVRSVTWCVVGLSLLLSIPAGYDMFRHRISADFGKQGVTDERYQDISDFLKKQKSNEIVMIPFGENVMCSGDDFGLIAGYSGAFVRNSYAMNFLLSEKVERAYAENEYWWKDDSKFKSVVLGLKDTEYVIMRNTEVDIFEKKISEFSTTDEEGVMRFSPDSLRKFNGFTVYHKNISHN